MNLAAHRAAAERQMVDQCRIEIIPAFDEGTFDEDAGEYAPVQPQEIYLGKCHLYPRTDGRVSEEGGTPLLLSTYWCDLPYNAALGTLVPEAQLVVIATRYNPWLTGKIFSIGSVAGGSYAVVRHLPLTLREGVPT